MGIVNRAIANSVDRKLIDSDLQVMLKLVLGKNYGMHSRSMWSMVPGEIDYLFYEDNATLEMFRKIMVMRCGKKDYSLGLCKMHVYESNLVHLNPGI